MKKIFILDYSTGLVWEYKIPEHYTGEQVEEFLSDKFNLDNIHFMITDIKQEVIKGNNWKL